MRLPLDYGETMTWVDNRHSRFVEPLPNLNPHRTAISSPTPFFITILADNAKDIFKNKKIGSVHLFPALKGCV
jgi:hypothetical protein